MINNIFTFFAAVDCQRSGFLGLRPWWHYLPDDRFEGCTVKDFKFLGADSDMGLVLLAVIDDLLRIAGMVAVGFVIVGAIQYITSQGEPEKTAQAQSTIVNALIGLAIAIVAVAFVTFLGHRLGR